MDTRRFRITLAPALAVVALALATAALPALGNHYILCGDDDSKCELPPSPPDGDLAAKSAVYPIVNLVLPDGKTLVAGMIQQTPAFAGPSAGYSLAFQRLNIDGTPDLAFNGTGTAQVSVWGYYESVVRLLVQPDGKIVAGGFAADPIGIGDRACYPAWCKIYPVFVRLNEDGTLDTSFNRSGRLILEFGDADRGDDVEIGFEPSLQSDGGIVVRSDRAGAESVVSGHSVVYPDLVDAARVNADGTLDNSFHGLARKVREIPYFPPPAVLNFQGLWGGASPANESGWGINLVHQGDTIFATWFTYDETGRPLWLSMTARRTAATAPTFTGDVIETRGLPLGATPAPANAVQRTVVGTGSIRFDGLDWGLFSYSVKGVTQSEAISRTVFGPMPTCEYFATPGAAPSGNFQNLWWAANRDDDGWGINVTQQGNTIFATWFTYDADGAPLWLSATMASERPGVYRGTLVRTSGPPFGAVPFDPASVTRTDVGTATLSFISPSSGELAYTVGGVAGSRSIMAASFVPPATTVCLQSADRT